MSITHEELRQVMPLAGLRIDVFIDPLNDAMVVYDISTPLRMAAFLAQIAHESGELKYVKELATGHEYEGRTDLGNVDEGDGIRFKGRGLLQITGRENYRKVSEALFDDYSLLVFPERLEEPHNAAMSAGWFWSTRNLNNLADQENFKGITRAINGGYNHLAEREMYYNRAKEVLGGLV